MTDIEDIWKNENDDKRLEKTEIIIKKKKIKEDVCCGTGECGDGPSSCSCKYNTNNGGCSKEGGCTCKAKGKLLGIRKDEKNEEIDKDNIIPGIQKIYVKTYGCSHNTSDSEYMMGLLNEYGYKLVESFEECDACVINSCTVKNPSQDAFINYIARARSNGKKIVVSGCVPQGDKTLPGLEDCSIVGTTQIDRIVEVVEETLKGNIVKLLAKKELPSLDLPKIRRNAYVEIIPINTGCLGSCTYCKTKHARGKLGSYTIEAIVNACIKASKEGVKEIWLTSEDTGAYGRDINTDLPTLLMEILKTIPEEVMIRLGMTNPPYIMEHMEKMVKILNHPNVFSFLHIPVQAGSNSVLDKMNREYKIEDFEQLCDYLLAHVPNITISTDIICGFPSETKEQFDETLALIEKYKFPVINISQFYPRPGTVAAKWKRVDTKEVKRRSTETFKLFTSYQNYSHLLGTIQRIWVHDNKDEGKAPSDDLMIAHNKSYVKVLVKRDNTLIGKQVLVKVVGIHKWHVEGEIIEKSPKRIKVNFEDHFKGLYSKENKDYSNIKTLHRNQLDIHEAYLVKNTTNMNEIHLKTSFDEEVYLKIVEKKKVVNSILYFIISIVLMGIGVSKLN